MDKAPVSTVSFALQNRIETALVLCDLKSADRDRKRLESWEEATATELSLASRARVQILYLRGQIEEAVSLAERLISTKSCECSDRISLLMLLAVHHVQRGDSERAKQYLKEFESVEIVNSSHEFMVYYLNGCILSFEGKFHLAIEEFTRIIESENAVELIKWFALLMRASTYTHCCEFKNAYEDYCRVLMDEKIPTELLTYAKVGRAFCDLFLGSDSELESIRELSSCLGESLTQMTHDLLSLNVGVAHFFGGMTERATRTVAKVLQREGGKKLLSWQGCCIHAALCLEQKDFPGAREQAEAAIKEAGGNALGRAYCLHLLASIQVLADRNGSAVSAASDALEIDGIPKSLRIQLLTMRSIAYQSLGKTDEANRDMMEVDLS